MDETHSKTLILVGGGHAHLYLIKQMKKALKEADVQLLQKERVSVIEHGHLEMESSKILPYNFLIIATGPVAHPNYL
ncbi:hypothetical protein [Petrocella sp. FN5]|uniref:hypothetical protein n=1 Tax=Petrocella sp. FN5 TaxID=3032002 RepID=UPI0023DA17CA|nr:hypothetical protein [Petrocella sp. FN5]MDF1617604.1 hypothetical protein [Petrocella sp. FN5]